jgi:trypsin-like peptidase
MMSRLRLVAATFALLVGAAVCLVPRPGGANLPREIGERTMPGVAFLVAADLKDGQLAPMASGSGTILTSDGAVLTNLHVIYDKDNDRLRDAVAIGLLKGFDKAPELTCLAVPSHGILSQELDLALVKCELDLSGKPYKPSRWPSVPVGSSADLMPGSSELYIMGYPGVGGPTINVTKGTVSGFLGKEGGAGRFWIKTDAAIAHGNSGGTAVDDQGLLVAIPTAVFPGQQDNRERVGLLRPVELARPLIAQAIGGWNPSPPETPTPAPQPAPSGPAAGGTSREAEACALRSGVTLTGRLIAADNHAPIEGAFVIVLKPGLKRGNVADDYSDIEDAAFTYAISNQDGEWTMRCPLPRDKRFTVMVLAKGYHELSEDGVLDTKGAPARYSPWEVVRLSRNAP